MRPSSLARPASGTVAEDKRRERGQAKVTLRLPRELLDELLEYARERGLSQGQAIQAAIRLMVDE